MSRIVCEGHSLKMNWMNKHVDSSIGVHFKKKKKIIFSKQTLFISLMFSAFSDSMYLCSISIISNWFSNRGFLYIIPIKQLLYREVEISPSLFSFSVSLPNLMKKETKTKNLGKSRVYSCQVENGNPEKCTKVPPKMSSFH